MSVKNRIKEFLEVENITISSFEKLLNLSNGYVNSISKSIGIPPYSFTLAIPIAFLGEADVDIKPGNV